MAGVGGNNAAVRNGTGENERQWGAAAADIQTYRYNGVSKTGSFNTTIIDHDLEHAEVTSGSSATNLLAIGSDRGIQHNLSVSVEQEATTMQSWCCAPPPRQILSTNKQPFNDHRHFHLVTFV